MLVFVDGCSHYASADVLKKWSEGTSAAIVATNPRRAGSKSIQPYASFPLTTPILPTSDYYVIGFAFRLTGLFSVDFRLGGTVQVKVSYSAKVFSVYRGDGTPLGQVNLEGIIFENEWYYLEVGTLVHDSAGTVEIRLNGIPVLSLSGKDTRSGVDGIDRISLYYSTLFTDIYVDSAAFHGDCLVDTARINGNGAHTDFIPSAGTNYENVDDDGAIDDDATYNTEAAQGSKDCFTTENIPSRPLSSIVGTALTLVARKDGAGSRALTPFIRIGTTDYQHPTKEMIVSDVYHGLQAVWEANPALSGEWSEAAVNGLQIGCELTTGLV